MSTVLLALLGSALVIVLTLGFGVWLVWRTVGPDDRVALSRIEKLPVRRKLALAAALTSDQRIPKRVRAIPPLLILYLASPLDLIPDFIPVIGLLDDVAVGIVGIGLLLKFTPRDVLNELIARLEQ
jgi:uncharacterized membrane protein YkvA (DUF1232 family)